VNHVVISTLHQTGQFNNAIPAITQLISINRATAASYLATSYVRSEIRYSTSGYVKVNK